MGIINVGGTGTITVDGKEYTMQRKEAIYIGAGTKDVKLLLNVFAARYFLPPEYVAYKITPLVEAANIFPAEIRTVNKHQLLLIESCPL